MLVGALYLTPSNVALDLGIAGRLESYIHREAHAVESDQGKQPDSFVGHLFSFLFGFFLAFDNRPADEVTQYRTDKNVGTPVFPVVNPGKCGKRSRGIGQYLDQRFVILGGDHDSQAESGGRMSRGERTVR